MLKNDKCYEKLLSRVVKAHGQILLYIRVKGAHIEEVTLWVMACMKEGSEMNSEEMIWRKNKTPWCKLACGVRNRIKKAEKW